MPTPRTARLVALGIALVLIAPLPACMRRAERRLLTPGGISFSSLGLAAALAEAGKRDTLLMVDVYTEWCGWCRKLENETFTDRRVVDAARALVAIRLNPETQRDGADLARRYGVEGFPVVLFLRPDGAVAGRIDGYVDADGFLDALPRSGRR